MSLLKLLFDLPDTGGEGHFTVEEQEELLAFEHNLDEGNLDGYATIPDVDDQMAFFQGPAYQDGSQQGPMGGALEFPVANGVHSSLEVARTNEFDTENVGGNSIRIDAPAENGHGFGTSTTDELPLGSLEEDELRSGPGFVTSTVDEPTLGFAHGFDNSMTDEQILDSLVEGISADGFGNLTTEEPTLGSPREDAPIEKHVASTKHEGTGRALWIKWRGKWQAGIQVSAEDCRAATVKAMPTYGKKEYVPIYLVNTRSYIWVDAQNSCSISENPEPLLSGTHDEWRLLMPDTGAPRRRMFLSLGWEMLDISDRLHILGVVERARFVSVWKEFAKEASEASKYSELGSLLVRIQAVVEPIYIRQSWSEKRLKLWAEECLKAETAAIVEKLTKELIRVILWDEAAPLWEAPMQPVLDPGWKNWKGPAFDEVTTPDDASPVPVDNSVPASNSSALTVKADKEANSTRKRRRKSEKFGKSEEEIDPSHPLSSDGRISTRKQKKLDKHNHALPSSSAAVGTQSMHTMKDGQSHGFNNLVKDPLRGDIFPASVKDGGSVVKVEQSDQHTGSAGGRCMGRTRRKGEQCSFKARSGSEYCEQHMKGAVAGYSGGIASGGSVEGVVGDMNISKLVADLSIKDRKSFARAREMLCKYMNGGLSKSKEGVHCHQTLERILEDASKDLPSGDMLLKIVSAEKERLGKMVLEEGIANRKSSKIIWQSASPFAMDVLVLPIGSEAPKPELEMVARDSSGASQLATSSSQVQFRQGGQDFGVDCCLCSQKFEQLSVLGKHWREEHKREAGLFEKCMICRICDKKSDNFRNKLGLVRHWRAAHAAIPMSSPGWSVCLICDKTCKDFDHLWQHVEDQHHHEWSSNDFAGRLHAALISREGQECCFCAEIFSTSWALEHHIRALHKEQGLQHSGVKRTLDTLDDEVTKHDSKVSLSIRSEVPLKYICRHCGLQFPLLPDLGRHHKAVHAADYPSASGKLPKRKRNRKMKQERGGSEWPVIPAGQGEGTDKEGTGKKWRYRARAKAKNVSRGRTVPMKKQSGGAEAILQRMKAVQQVLEDHRTKRPPRKRDRKAERARRLARLEGDGEIPPLNKYKCRFCGLQFPLLPDLGRHHQAEHSAVKQAFITNGSGQCQTGIFTLSRGGILQEVHGEKLKRSPNSRELLEVARSACCKDWLFNELGKRFTELPSRLFVQAAHLCSEAKVEIRWHQEKYVCPDGCTAYAALDDAGQDLDVDLGGFTGSFPKTCPDDVKESAMGAVNLPLTSKASKLTRIVLSEDLSNGLERVPIACVVDENIMEPCTCSLCIETGRLTVQGDTQPWDNFVYITQRRLDPSLGVDTKSSEVGCSCSEEECSASTCDHVSMFDSDNSGACTIYGDPIKGRFPYDIYGRIILEVGFMVYECNSSCHCKDWCQNRILQKGVRVKLEVFRSRHKGWAVRAAEPISRGTFICEYVGEVLNDSEANKRGERYDQMGCSFLYDIDAHLDVSVARPGYVRPGSKPFVIDATKYGNVARFINHSCEPNLINYEVLVESMDCQLAHIGFFAQRDIATGEELAYDYRYKLLPGKGSLCHCGAPSCRGRLY